jgi:hypothetical protein
MIAGFEGSRFAQNMTPAKKPKLQLKQLLKIFSRQVGVRGVFTDLHYAKPPFAISGYVARVT